MKLAILEDSVNYTATVVKLPSLQPVLGLDNLVRVTIFGSDCLIGKDTNVFEAHLFFPAECQISEEFLYNNNLYRHVENNKDQTKAGFFEDNGRVKSMKFKGVISSGFVIPVSSLSYLGTLDLKVGEEFNSINGHEICKKYYKKLPRGSQQEKQAKLLDSIVDSRLAPEHFDTAHLLRNVDKLKLDDYIAVTVKLHGTSARYFNTSTHRKLNWYEKLLLKFGVKVEREEYSYVCASRRVIKSINFRTLDGKKHYYDFDIWSHVGEQHLKDKLGKTEAVYCEIVGRDHAGAEIQSGYSYGFECPQVYVYRISHISPQGIEVDLPYHQMKERAIQLGLNVCPEVFYGKLKDFLIKWAPLDTTLSSSARDVEQALSDIFYGILLEKPSVLCDKVVEEGFCIRVDKYPRPEILKIKAKSFLLAESKNLDAEVNDLEVEN